ncbi:methyl-accepting chemotaxis protein [Litoribacillus peritrichatus]|uniref:Methyl-accepting chemotaxis protein n=1 Tax=Litoribacillus peritrichatus TaxID=718191 RepID=A0ABP7MBI6_9GAMM
MKSIKSIYTLYFISFMLVVAIITSLGIMVFVSPKLKETQQKSVSSKLDLLSAKFMGELNKVQAQQRAITQTVAELSSNQIDQLQPSLVDQYGDVKVFGGGIWPLPYKRDSSREKHSTFFHRDSSGKLIVNTHWNSDESLKYFEQGWHKAGQNAPKGQCAWAPAYKDSASIEARTNCAMGIYKNGQLWGVSTIDVTLGFFNDLAQKMETELQGQVLIVEPDGKILNNSKTIEKDLILSNLSKIKNSSEFAAQVADYLSSQSTSNVSDAQFTDKHGVEQSLFITNLPGTPWRLTFALPSSLINKQTSTVMNALLSIQLPLGVLIVLFVFFTFSKLSSRLSYLRKMIDNLSEGNADLTARIRIKANDEVGEIGNSVNKFIEFLHKIMLSVSDSSTEISNCIAKVDEHVQKNRTIISQHSEETSQAVVAITEMSATAEAVADNASDSASFTQKVQEEASVSKQTVSKASEGVQGLLVEVESAVRDVENMNKNTKQIAEVLKVIGDIAEQTNLLALNAAIEAARAGEQGRGFAVVADEVRALAARTQNSTSEINDMIGQLESGVSSVVTAMERTKSSCQQSADNTNLVTGKINNMNTSIIEISGLSAQIAEAAQEQKTVSEEIDRIMNHIQSIVSEISESAESNAVNSEDLTTANNQLVELVTKFRL